MGTFRSLFVLSASLLACHADVRGNATTNGGYPPPQPYYGQSTAPGYAARPTSTSGWAVRAPGSRPCTVTATPCSVVGDASRGPAGLSGVHAAMPTTPSAHARRTMRRG